MTVVKNGGFLYLAKGVNLLFPFLILPLLISILGIEGYGQVVFIQTLMSFGVTLVDYGYNLVGVRDLANASSIMEQNRIIANGISFKIVLAFAFLLVTFFCVYFTGYSAKNLIFGWLQVMAMAIYPLWIFQGLEQMKYSAFANILARIGAFVVIFYLQEVISEAWQVLAILNLFLFISALLSLLIVRLIGWRVKLTFVKTAFLDEFARGKDIFTSNIIVQFYSNIALVISNGLLSLEAVGILGVIYKIRDIGFSLVGPIQQAVYPRLATLISTNEIQMAWRYFYRTILLMVFLILLLIVIVSFWFEGINSLLFKGGLSELVSLYGLIVAMLLLIPFGGMLTAMQSAFGDYVAVKKSSIISGLVCLVVVWPFTSVFGIEGALLTIIFSYASNVIVGTILLISRRI